MEAQDSITYENLRVLITSFYTKVLNDDRINHFFTQELGNNIQSQEWQEHIELLVDYWLSQLLDEGEYEGNVVGMHVHIHDLKREDFIIWLEIFSEAVDEVYQAHIVKEFMFHGKYLADKFIRELNI